MNTYSDEEDDDWAMPSDIEAQDEELVHFLQSNTNFLVNMSLTGAFSDFRIQIKNTHMHIHQVKKHTHNEICGVATCKRKQLLGRT